MDPTAQLVPGLRVETFDRRRVGTIESIEPGRILLRSGRRRPFWLGDVLVRAVDEKTATLHVDRRTLSRYREPLEDQDWPRKRRPFSLSLICSAVLFGLGIVFMSGL